MTTKRIAGTIAVLLGQLFMIPVAAGEEVTALVRFHDENTGLTVLRANVSLPVPGYWFAPPDAVAKDAGLSEVIVAAAPDTDAILSGRRMAQHEEQQEIDGAQRPLGQLGWVIRQFIEKHEGRPPKSVDELGDELGESTRKQLAGNYRLMDDLAIDSKQTDDSTHLIAYEIAPLVDDGKHWVLLSNGRVERRAIDPKLAPQVNPQRKAGLEPAATQADYIIHARLLNDSPTKVELKNSLTGKTTSVLIDPAKATPGEREVLGEWAFHRLASFPTHAEDVSSAILPHWFKQAPALYGVDPSSFAADRNFPAQRRQGRNTTVFNVFGGRAAISETLQMQDIETRQTSDEKETPIREIKGVEVKSHPFEEMLGTQPGGQIPLAKVIPADRFFAYFPKPAGLISWLDGGAEFLFNAGSSATGRSLQYGLSERYLAALGMDREWMRRLLDSGAVEEIAISTPDFFFIDGTEVTAVVLLKNPVLAAGLLQLLGINNLDTTAVRKGANGESSHWAQRGSLLFVSTDAGELARSLELQSAAGEGSLGRSAEFRYLLTKLPLQDSTRAFIYLSDPFIRRLVGPETKISQHRRIHARGEMEGLVAGSLLAKLDGNENATPSDLIAKHYVSTPKIATDAVLDPESGAISKTFGTLPRMHSLIDLGITHATARETAAYREYLQNYSSYWRRFFDPIALRLDQPDPATYEVSVFILPLIDNSIYNSIREMVASGEDESPLRIPVIEPEPVATLSMNLREEIWVKQGGEMLDGFAKTVGLDTSILDFLGPDIHLAIADADPIFEIGSGELADAFGPMDSRQMPMLAAAISMFTRPTALCVGLTDAAAVRRALDQSVGGQVNLASRDVTGNLYKVTGREGWVYRVNFFNFINLRLGIEVQDRFLVVRNMPFTSPFKITGTKAGTQPGAQLSLSPRACRLQLPALFASAAERERSAAFSGISDLLPLLVTGSSSLQEATGKHNSWFGFRPIHPAGGEWKWNGNEMTSSRYGTVRQPTQPDYPAGSRDFGLLRRVDGVDVGMRLEDDGLRTTARWQLRPASK